MSSGDKIALSRRLQGEKLADIDSYPAEVREHLVEIVDAGSNRSVQEFLACSERAEGKDDGV